MDYWLRLPEAVRWILLLPAVLAVWFLAVIIPAVVGNVAAGLGLASPFWVGVGQAAISAATLFPVAFALAPRAPRAVGWAFFVPIMGVLGILVLLMILRRLGTWGLLGDSLRPPPGEVWDAADWRELAQGVVWLVVGTYSFRGCLRDAAPRPPSALDATIAAARTRSTDLPPAT